MIGGLLTIECEVAENGYWFSAFHRFAPGEWAHFSVIPVPQPKQSGSYLGWDGRPYEDTSDVGGAQMEVGLR